METRSTIGRHGDPLSPAEYRRALAHFPTGVVVVAALPSDGPKGMTIGSFTSVSVEPLLVGFFPAVTSSSWPPIAAHGLFTVNILSHRQENVCRALLAKGANKFESLDWHEGPTGQPHIDRAVGWIDCSLEAVHEAGDHYIAVARVDGLSLGHSEDALVFWRGTYGSFVVSELSSAG